MIKKITSILFFFLASFFTYSQIYISGIVTDESVDECYKIFKKNNIKISTICNLKTVENHVSNGDLITLQLNEGVIYMGQIDEDEEVLDKYKYV